MAKFDHPYLNLSRMQMLRRVRLKPRGLAEGTFAGPHASHYRGAAVEFADYRNYVEGDDIRLVDWKVFARTDKHYVRLFEAERNLLTYLTLDTSGSMRYAGTLSTTDAKLVYAAKLAAAMAFMVVSAGDEVSLSLTGDKVHEHLPTRSSWQHLAAVVETLGAANAQGRTDLGGCLMEVFRRIRRRGVLIVLSDFLDAGGTTWKAIDLFRRSQFDVLLFHVVHPEEIDLPDVPMARFVGAEHERGSFAAEPDVVRRVYRERFVHHLAQIEAGARSRGCDWFLARTDADPYVFLKHCFLTREGR